MRTLQNEVQVIAGDEPYSFLLYSYTYNPKIEFEGLSVSIWMKRMEICVSYTINKQEHTAIYGMIDVEAVHAEDIVAEKVFDNTMEKK